jgi:hypothetical protein
MECGLKTLPDGSSISNCRPAITSDNLPNLAPKQLSNELTSTGLAEGKLPQRFAILRDCSAAYGSMTPMQ